MAKRHVTTAAGPGRQRQPDDGRPAGGPVARHHVDRNAPGGGNLGDQRRERRFVGHQRVVARHVFHRRREGRGERPEPERREQLETGLTVGTHVAERVEVHFDRRVGPDARQLPALARQVGVRQERLAVALLRHVAGVREQLVERTEARQQLHRALVADARYAPDVVRGVAGERQHVHDSPGRDAEALPHAFDIEPRPFVARVEDDDRLVDQLQQVLVAGDDDDPVSCRVPLDRDGSDHVVGLEPRAGEDPHAQRLGGAVDQRHLDHQVVGHRRTVRLVVAGQFVAEGGSGHVEGRDNRGRTMVVDELAQHRDEAEDGVARRAVGRGQSPNRVVGAIHLGIAVDHVEGRPGGIHGKVRQYIIAGSCGQAGQASFRRSCRLPLPPRSPRARAPAAAGSSNTTNTKRTSTCRSTGRRSSTSTRRFRRWWRCEASRSTPTRRRGSTEPGCASCSRRP